MNKGNSMLEKMRDIEAYTSKIFEGSPHTICPLEHWLSAKLQAQIPKGTTAYASIDGIKFLKKNNTY